MYHSQDLTVWQARFKALLQALQGSTESGSFPRRTTIEQLQECLEKFCQRQFHFFMDGFGEQSDFTLEPSAAYPVDYVYKALLLQMANDIEVFRRAGERRKPDNPTVRQALAIGDHLTAQALQPMITHGYLSDSVAMTYFEKTVSIRLVPYAPLALVALPETCVLVNRDYLAIPHELGHHLVWHGRHPDGKRMRSKLTEICEGQPRWLKLWLEEIFADVYGCLIGGPVMGLDFQDLMLDNKRREFLETGDDHPLGAVRPFIYSKVLRMMGYVYAPDKLDGRWQIWLERRGVSLETKIPLGEEILTVAEIRAQIEAVIERILQDVLTPIFAERRQNPQLCWTADVAPDADLMILEKLDDTNGPLYGQFNAFVARLPREIPPDFAELMADPNDARKFGVGRGTPPTKTRLKGTTGLWFDSLLTPEENLVFVQHAVWEKVLAADGWSVKGPENLWPPG